MKNLGIFLILALLLILLISCGNSTSNTSCDTTTTATELSPAVSTTQPTTTKTPITTKAPITSTSKATETQPTSTSETAETDPTVIRVGFTPPAGLLSCPLFIAYEMPRSCSLSDATLPITLYFSLQNILVPDDASENDYFEIYLWDNESLFQYPLRNITIKEAKSKNYFRPDSGPLFPSEGETFEIPLSIFSEEPSNRWHVVVDYYGEDNTWHGSESLLVSYEKNDETIVFLSYEENNDENSGFYD